MSYLTGLPDDEETLSNNVLICRPCTLVVELFSCGICFVGSNCSIDFSRGLQIAGRKC